MSGMSPELIADSFVTAAAVIGLVLFRQVLKQEKTADSTPRFVFAINMIILLMVARLLQWFTGWTAAGVLTYILACFVPLAALLVTETVLRRHMPQALKVFVAAGAAFLSLAALLPLPFAASTYLYVLAVFQFATFGALAILVHRRDRDGLSPAENAAVDRLALSFLFILPFAITDFRTEAFDAPVRMSGIAILLLCWLAVGMRARTSRQSEVILALLVSFIALGVATIAIGAIVTIDARALVQVVVILISASLVTRIVINVREIRSNRDTGDLLSYVATTPAQDHATFIAGLQASAHTSGALLLGADGLSDFDAAFRKSFDDTPIIRRSDLDLVDDPKVAEQFDWFFRKYDASHAMLVSQSPFQVMALNIPALSQSDEVEHELRVAQRMAVLLARGTAAHG